LKQKQLTVCFLIIICTVVLLGCGNNEIQSQASSTTKTIEDMAGRSLIVPDKIDKVFCTSATGSIVIYTLCPEKLVGWNYDLSPVEKKYILPEYQELPNLGGWFAKGTGNIEEILKIAPDIVISLGVINDAERSNADQIEQQLDIPVLLVDGELTEMDRTYEYLGELLGMESEAQQLADYCRQTVDEVTAKAEQIPEDERVRVYYAEGAEGLETDPQGSIHTQVLDLVAFDNDVLDDFIIMKSNGTPTYNFACVVDDAKMHITHILRAEEHLSNTPRQILIYEALGYPLPVFAHVSMILAPDRSKLSKRHGATSVEEFQDLGYLPEALINYLALLGWSPEGEEEVLSISELVRQFSLDRVGKTAAIYDVKKLTWMNGHYLNEKDLDDVIDLVIPYFREKNLIPQQLNAEEMAYLRRVVGAVRTRVKTLAEVADASEYFYKDDFSYEEKGVRKHFRKENAAEYLKKASEKLADLQEFDLETTEKAYRDLSEELGVKTGNIIHPTRMALSGRTMGPGLFDIMVILGKEKTLERLDRAIDFISSLDEM
jgi:glutamyl-tRNA synthetase